MKLFFLLILSSLFLQTTVGDWKEFTSLEGRFRILTPGDFTEKTDTVKTELGALEYHTFFYQVPNEQEAENLFYMVSYCDYPDFTVHSDSTDLLKEFFNTTIQAAVESVGGTLIYSADISIDNYPGKFWRIEYLKHKAVIKTKAYVVGQRYYALQTISYTKKSLNQSSDKFFNSFHLI